MKVKDFENRSEKVWDEFFFNYFAIPETLQWLEPIKNKIIGLNDEFMISFKDKKELEKAKIWQGGNIKKYHTELSEIIRRYTEMRFKVIALELTTDEIIENLKDKIAIEQIENIKWEIRKV